MAIDINNGFFISFEGGEGSGKTTQINRLSGYLTAQGYRVVTTREPGGTPEGEAIRNVLVQRSGGDWEPMAEVLLLYAARLMHIKKIIKPALKEGKIVISDRFAYSTIAYQGYGHKLDLDKIKAVQSLSITNFKPNLTFVFDIDPKTGLERSNKRLAVEKGYEKTEDRFERLDIEFHERLRQGFRSIAKEEGERCCIINADQDYAPIFESIKNQTMSRIKMLQGEA